MCCDVCKSFRQLVCFAVDFVVCCGVSALPYLIHAVKRQCWHAGHFDQLVCETMELLDRYTGHLKLKRKRNEGEVSLTLNAKRPDLCMLVRNALLFKGEDKTEEGKLDQAVAELKQKMRRWSQSYHGQVNLSLCICQIFVAMQRK